MKAPHHRGRRLLGSLVGVVAALTLVPEIAGAPPAARGAVLLGTVEVAATVWHIRLDDAGRRLALSTVRYAENALPRNELPRRRLPQRVKMPSGISADTT